MCQAQRIRTANGKALAEYVRSALLVLVEDPHTTQRLMHEVERRLVRVEQEAVELHLREPVAIGG